MSQTEANREVFGPTRIAYMVRAVAAVSGAFGMAALTGLIVWMVADSAQDAFPPPVLWAIMAVMCGGLLYGAWRISRSYLLCAVELSAGAVHVGRGWFRLSFSCEDVVAIRIAAERILVGVAQEPPHLVIQTPARRLTLSLAGQETACAEALYRRCPNAVYVDAAGEEHLPVGTERPLEALLHLAKERSRRGRYLLAVGAGILLCSLAVCLVLLILVQQGEDPPHVLGLFAPFVPAGMAIAWAGLVQIRKGRRLAGEVSARQSDRHVSR